MDKDKFQVIATKVSATTKELIGRLCRKKGLTEYEMLQMMCDCLVRYMDDRHNLTPELEQAMAMFEHMVGWKDAYNLADPTTEGEVQEAVYITADREGRRRGFRAHMVTKPFMGQWEQTDNAVTIYERMTEVLMPEIYRKLRLLAVDMDCTSIVELMHTMIDAQTIMELNSDFRREFEDANRSDYGRPIEYGQRTRQKKHRTPDSLASDQRIKFTPEDVPDIQELKHDSGENMENNMGFRPFDQEW